MKKLLSAMLSLVLLLSLLPINTQATADVELVMPKEYESGPSVREWDPGIDMDALEAVLFEGFYHFQSPIDISAFKIPASGNYEEILRNMIWDEMTECFQVYGLGVQKSGGILTAVYASYSLEATEYYRMYDAFLAAADALLKGIAGNSGLGDVEKALLIHDRLALQCEYDYNQGENRYTGYGAMVDGAAVCQGYAEAYDYLLECVGIDGYICSSDALNHAWNIIYINDTPYHVDVTWDDVAWGQGERGTAGDVRHDNFLLSSDGIYAAKHTATDYDTTPQDTTYDNYFWKTYRSAFQLVEDEIYYIDAQNNQLVRYSDRKVLCDVHDIWRAEGGYWGGNYARLATDGEDLLFSLSIAVYKYDLETDTLTTVYEPVLADYNAIYSFAYRDGYLICDINGAPTYGDISSLYQEKIPYQKTGPTPPADPEFATDLVFLQAPSLSFQDYIGMQVMISSSLKDNYDEIYVEAVQKDPTEGDIVTRLEGFLYYYDMFLVFDQQILSWSMAERVTLTLYGVKDGKTYIGQAYSASVETLAQAMLKRNAVEGGNAKLCTVLVDMLNYGAAVQTTFAHNATLLPNTQIAAYASYGTTGVPAMDASVNKAGSGSIVVYQDSISMQSKVELQLLFLQPVAAYTAKAVVNGVEKDVFMDTETMAAYGGTVLRVAVGASQMRETFTIALYDANGAAVTTVYTVSVEAYAKTLIGGAQNDVAVTMMRYGDAVAAYAAG